MQLEHEGSPFVHGFLWGLGFAIAGAANEQYQKCRTGFRERKWVSDSDK